MLKKLTLAFLVTTVSVFATDIKNVQVDVKPSQQTVEWRTGHTESGRKGLKKITKVEVWQGPKVTQTLTLSWNELGSSDSKSTQFTLSYLTTMSQFWTPDNNLSQVSEQDVIGLAVVDAAEKAAEWKLQLETVGADLGYSEVAVAQLKLEAQKVVDTLASQIQPTVMHYKANSRSEKIYSEVKRIGNQCTDAWKVIETKAKEAGEKALDAYDALENH